MNLPIETNWTKIPGPNFVGDPDGRIIDINDWLVLVKSHLLFTSAVQLTRREANDPERFEEAKAKSIRIIQERFYGDLRVKLLKIRYDLKFALNPVSDMSLLVEFDELIKSIPGHGE